MSDTNTNLSLSDPAYADHDPLAYMIGNGVEPAGSFMDYSPAQARGLVQEARSAVQRQLHSSAARSIGTTITFTDENRPKHLRTVRASLATSR